MQYRYLLPLALALTLPAPETAAQAAGRNAEARTQANYKLATKFSREYLRKFTYDQSVRPRFIEKTDCFYYSYRTSAGRKFWFVDPKAAEKRPLFDHATVAAAVTEATQKAVDANNLNVSRVVFAKDRLSFTFVSEGFRFKYDCVKHVVRKRGKARRTWRDRLRRTRGGRTGRGNGRGLTQERLRQLTERRRRSGGSRRRGSGSGPTRGTSVAAGPVYSPDRSMYVFAKDHNLFLVRGKEVAKPLVAAPANGKKDPGETNIVHANANDKSTGKATAAATPAKGAASRRATPTPAPRFTYDRKSALQLSKDGVESYSFGATRAAGTTRGTQRRQNEREDRQQEERQQEERQREERQREERQREERNNRDENRTRNDGRRGRRFGFAGRRGSRGSTISWAKSSKAFYTTRRDSRGLKDLYLIDSVADPRPSLRSYKYTMPGEDNIRKSELFYFHRDTGKLTQVKKKWVDESYRDVGWHADSDQLRFMRRDRLLRNVEYCSLDPKTGKIDVLFAEGSKDGYLKLQSFRVLKKRKQFIWWSERTGWGHFYLYDQNATLLNPITRGAFRASRILSVDEKKGVMYFRGNGREKGENIYYEHTYRVNLDGTGLTLLDPGNATHRSTFSPTKKYLVDNTSRVDAAPTSILRNDKGEVVLHLETSDHEKLLETGWKLPETFEVKAADGVTTLYGNMWKPFDFDAKKKYPIILNVYPGPQQEGVTHSFSATNDRQQLAQLGFIVVQVGHRGGTPTRSRAYANYGYYNLRDYGLADKKAAVEQLAMRHAFIDAERVGIYGHSGGGFMSAAALMKEPFNEFFKVAVASAGNHDNNIYNHSWSERYHGLKEIKEGQSGDTSERRGTGDSTRRESERGRTTRGRDTNVRGETQRGGTQRGGTERRGTRRGDARRSRTTGTGSTGTATNGGEGKEKKKRFEIRVPTNAELAANLKGHLLLVHGELDNNVHPANTMRLVNALIKANKRFDMLIIPRARHSFGSARNYFKHRMWEYFAEHLLGDRRSGADILAK